MSSLIANPVAAPTGPIDVSVPNGVDVLLETGSLSHFVEYELTSASGYGLKARYLDENNQVYLKQGDISTGRTSVYLYRVSGGSLSILANNVPFGTTTVAGDLIGYQDNVDGTFFYYLKRRNATTQAYEIIWQSGTFTSGTPQTTKGYIQGRSSSANVLAKNVRFGPIDNPLRIVTASIDAAFKPTVDIEYTGSPYGYRIAILRPDNTTVVLPAGAVTVVSNTIGKATLFFNTSIPSSEYGTSPIVSVVQVDETGAVVNGSDSQPIRRGASVTMPSGPTPVAIAGLNRGSFTTNYYSQINLARDMASQTELRANGATLTYGSDGGSGMNRAGVMATIPAGLQQLMPKRWPVGTYQLGNQGGAWPSGMTVTQALGTAGWSLNTTTKVVTVTQETDGSPTLAISGTAPAGGFRLSCLRTDEANPEKLWHPRQQAVLTFLKPKVSRSMDTQKNNGDFSVRDTIADFWTGPISQGISLEHIQQEANDLSVDPWMVVGWFWTTNGIKAAVNRVFSGLNPARTVWIEPPNETWNTRFYVWRFAAMDGLSAGYRSANGGTLAADPIPLSSINHGGVSYGGTPTQNFNAGDIVFQPNLGGVGMLLLKANRAITANDTADNHTGTTNAAWTVLASNNDAKYAMEMAYSDKAKQIFTALNEQLDAMGIARTRAVRVVAWQNGDVNAHKRVLKWGNLGAMHDAFATAPYFGGGQAGYSLGRYVTDYPGWTATEKALVATDLEAFKVAYFAIASKAVDDTIDDSYAGKQSMDTWMLANFGRRARWVCYEAGHHWVEEGWPANLAAAIRANFFPNVYLDPRHGQLYQRYIQRWNAKCGDLMCMYDQGGLGITAGTDNWTIMRDDLDFSNPNAAALNAVNA